VPSTKGDASVKLDFGLSDETLDAKFKSLWPHAFGLTYSVTLSPGSLETSIQVRNTGTETWEFQTLLHTYLKISVSIE
jgi:glucose-6-phosphate 1-epimerase